MRWPGCMADQAGRAGLWQPGRVPGHAWARPVPGGQGFHSRTASWAIRVSGPSETTRTTARARLVAAVRRRRRTVARARARTAARSERLGCARRGQRTAACARTETGKEGER
jgi:hypothetical protein